MLEMQDLLRRVFIVDFEILLGESGDGAAGAIGHGRIHLDQRDACAEGGGLGR